LTVEILEHSDTQSRQSSSNQFNSIEKTEENSTPMIMKRPQIPTLSATAASADASSDEEEDPKPTERQQVAAKKNSIQMNNVKNQKGPLPSPLGSAHSFDMQVANWRMEKLEVDSKSGSEEEFYDCLGKR
jgi:membrane-associated phosphatidylinositol transfer protein